METVLNSLEQRLVGWLRSGDGIEAMCHYKARNAHFLTSPVMLVGYTLGKNAAQLNFERSDPHDLAAITDEVFRRGDGFLAGGESEQGEYHYFGISGNHSARHQSGG